MRTPELPSGSHWRKLVCSNTHAHEKFLKTKYKMARDFEYPCFKKTLQHDAVSVVLCGESHKRDA